MRIGCDELSYLSRCGHNGFVATWVRSWAHSVSSAKSGLLDSALWKNSASMGPNSFTRQHTRRGARCEDFERVRKPERDGAGGYRIPFCFFFLSLPALTFSLKARSDLSLTSLSTRLAARRLNSSRGLSAREANALTPRSSARPVAKSSTRAHRSDRHSWTNAKQGHAHARKISDQ